MTKILLVEPEYNWPRGYAETPSRALLVLGTMAQYLGHEVHILHLEVDGLNIKEALQQWSPDIVGITVNTHQVRSARLIVTEIHKMSRAVKVMVGGPHAGAWDDGGPEVVVGPGENRWLEILGSNKRVHTLDDTPIPDYDLVDLRRYCGVRPVGTKPAIAIMASRGCPFKCIYCSTPKSYGAKVRYRSPEIILTEIDLLHRKYGIKEIMFVDDTFNLDHPWAYEIFERIIDAGLNKTMSFKITSRVNEKLVTRNFLKLARGAGVWNIFYGIESGSQYMLDRMKKGITVAEIKRAIKLTHEAGIKTQCSFIVGLPGETVGTLQATWDLIREIKRSMAGWGYACPYPGTEFEKQVKEKGHLKHIDYEDYNYGSLMARTDALSFKNLERFQALLRNGG